MIYGMVDILGGTFHQICCVDPLLCLRKENRFISWSNSS